jgi:hypothetical protein
MATKIHEDSLQPEIKTANETSDQSRFPMQPGLYQSSSDQILYLQRTIGNHALLKYAHKKGRMQQYVDSRPLLSEQVSKLFSISGEKKNLYESALIQLQKEVESNERTFDLWWGQVAQQYRNLKYNVTNAGYEIQIWVLTEGRWQERKKIGWGVMETPIKNIKWKIIPPKGHPFWANSQTIIPKLKNIIKKIRAEKVKTKPEETVGHPEFFSNPKNAYRVETGKRILYADNEKGVEYYQKMALEKGPFEVNIPCSPYWLGFPVRVKMNPMEDFGQFNIVGRDAGYILVKERFEGRWAIFAYYSTYFPQYMKFMMANRSVREKVATLCEMSTKK